MGLLTQLTIDISITIYYHKPKLLELLDFLIISNIYRMVPPSYKLVYKPH